MKTKQFLVVALAAMVGLAACSPEPQKGGVESVTLDQTSLLVKVGETAQLTATVTPAGAAEVTYVSSNSTIATVDPAGLVTGVNVGDAYIVATAGEKQTQCKVTVYEEGQTLIVVTPVSGKLKVGETLQLTANVQPAEKADLVRWSSDNDVVATVDDKGLVTAVAHGTASIRATVDGVTAECAITVTNPTGDESINHVSLNGTNYYIFQLGGTAADQIADKIVADFREDHQLKHFYIWGDGTTYIAGETTGMNFYGEVDGWVSLTVSTVGWSGFAYNCEDLEVLNTLSAIMDEPENYYLHLAMKSTDTQSHLLFLDGTSGSGKICIGSKDFVDAGTTYKPTIDFSRNGEWGEIEICMKDLIDQGLVYGNNNQKAANVFGFLSGGVAGTQLQFDAAFIYKKN